MTKNLMKKAHEMTREMVAKYEGINYQVQLGLCIKYLFELEKEKKEVERLENTLENKVFKMLLEKGLDYEVAKNTLNNILSLMEKEGLDFEEAFKINAYKGIAGRVINKHKKFETIRWKDREKLIRNGNNDLNIQGTENTNLSDYYHYENEVISYIIEYENLHGMDKGEDFWKYINNKAQNFINRMHNRQVDGQRVTFQSIENLEGQEYLGTSNDIEQLFELPGELIEAVINHEAWTPKQKLYIQVKLMDKLELNGRTMTQIFNENGYTSMLGQKELESFRRKAENQVIPEIVASLQL